MIEVVYLTVAVSSIAAWIKLRQPIFAVSLLTAVSLMAGEFYPLSNYPMYSDPDERENYLYLARLGPDETYVPLPVRELTGISAPKVKKMYKARLRSRVASATKVRSRRRVPTARERADAGMNLLDFLAGQAEQRDSPLPARTALIEVWIVYDGINGYHERPTLVAVAGAG